MQYDTYILIVGNNKLEWKKRATGEGRRRREFHAVGSKKGRNDAFWTNESYYQSQKAERNTYIIWDCVTRYFRCVLRNLVAPKANPKRAPIREHCGKQ
jgi:hypothetical protein